MFALVFLYCMVFWDFLNYFCSVYVFLQEDTSTNKLFVNLFISVSIYLCVCVYVRVCARVCLSVCPSAVHEVKKMKNVQTTYKSAHSRNICKGCFFFKTWNKLQEELSSQSTHWWNLVDRHSKTRAENSISMHQSFVCPVPLGPGILGT